MLGTASYLSPEQAQGGPVDARTDIYSLGAVLYEMLAGRPPFMGDTPVAVAYKQVNETPVVPSQFNPDVPARLDAVVMKALSKNPSNRYQTADEFSADLERVIKGQDVEATPLLAGVAAAEATQVISRPQQTSVLPPVEEPDGSGRKVWLGILIGILVVAVLAGGGYLLVSSLTNDNEGSVLVVVPNLVGMTREQAEADLTDRGLNPSRGTVRPIPPMPTPAPWWTRIRRTGSRWPRAPKSRSSSPWSPTPSTCPTSWDDAGRGKQRVGSRWPDLGSQTQEANADIEVDRVIRVRASGR